MSSYNKNIIEEDLKTGGYADDSKGIKHYLGVYEEDHHAKRFKTLGAKKYAYEDDDDNIHLTLAGVSKQKGAEELKERGGLEAFKDGFIFIKGGGNEAIYNDNINFKYMIDGGHTIEVTDNLYIKPSTYTLGLTNEYADLLNDSELWLEVLKKEML